MKKNKLILFVGLTLLIQTEPTHAAASIAELQTSLEVLKTKLVTLAQALGKINQKYTPVDELSPGQKTYFIILKSLAKGGSPQGLAEKMQEYANRADHEGLKTFIGQGYNEDKNAEIFFANLYNGILDSDEIITDPAAKNALSPDQLFPTNDALKTLIEKIIRAIDGKPPWEIGPMTPPRDHGPKGNPNPNPSTATPYADLSADQQVVYNELNDAWTEVENAAGMAIGIKIKPLKTLINKYADPNNNGLDGLRTFAAEKEANKATYKKDLQNLLTHIEKNTCS
ncbi:hypothetical protein IPF37_00850 [bacterium]|nr:MAG: hypothetical protein IPF37_00850 [bacterium]